MVISTLSVSFGPEGEIQNPSKIGIEDHAKANGPKIPYFPLGSVLYPSRSKRASLLNCRLWIH